MVPALAAVAAIGVALLWLVRGAQPDPIELAWDRYALCPWTPSGMALEWERAKIVDKFDNGIVVVAVPAFVNGAYRDVHADVHKDSVNWHRDTGLDACSGSEASFKEQRDRAKSGAHFD